jgi:predicted signal transduction protein with EAL and GGDEF domain
MRALKASILYFAAVFGVGFVLGTLRVLLVVPLLGVRWAELMELPVMVLASFYFARVMIRRFGPFAVAVRVLIGVMALFLLLAAEIAVTVLVQGQTLAQYVANRDPVSGVAYLLSLAAFALMPLFVRPRAEV